MKPDKALGIQYAALPYRLQGRQLRILLITSRKSRRWVVPKGWPVNGLKPQEAAAAEAAEEAGIIGEVASRPLGSYRYLKRLKADEAIAVQVIVFPFLVEAQVEDWKEQGQRSIEWFPYRRAASLVAEPGLARLIREFGAVQTASFVVRNLRRYRSWRFGAATG